MELRLKPADGSNETYASVHVPIQCKSGKDGVLVTLSWTTKAEGAPVSAAVDQSR